MLIKAKKENYWDKARKRALAQTALVNTLFTSNLFERKSLSIEIAQGKRVWLLA